MKEGGPRVADSSRFAHVIDSMFTFPSFPSVSGILLMAALCADAQLSVNEPFAYSAGTGLTGTAGGAGWASAWTQDGATGTVTSTGLSSTDALGNVLQVSGCSVTTQGAATTRNFRSVTAGPLTDVWISFLYQLPSGGLKFTGVSFCRGVSPVFAIQSPSTDSTANIWLGNYVSTGAASTGKGTFGKSHFIVLRLRKAAAAGGLDLVEAFVDPILGETPVDPVIVTASNFDFDSIRIAGQDGSPLFVDEIRIGRSLGDVTPHIPTEEMDSDGDGLTDAQEMTLGMDPHVQDTQLIQTIRSNADAFGLYDRAGILSLKRGGVVIGKTGDAPVSFSFDLEYSGDMKSWFPLQEFNRSIAVPPNKNFLRLNLGEH